MRTLYIDVYFLINLTVDILSLYFATILSKTPTTTRRLITAAVFGAICAVGVVFLPEIAILKIIIGGFGLILMGAITPRPSEIIKTFASLYCISPEEATDYFYALCRASDYIRTYRVSKDMKWIYGGKYGDLDITINLSKPEKDPKAIAAAKLQKQSSYPKCQLCVENEGYGVAFPVWFKSNGNYLPDEWYDFEGE